MSSCSSSRSMQPRPDRPDRPDRGAGRAEPPGPGRGQGKAYGNERGVGECVRSSGVPRENLFVSTKLAAEIKNYDGADPAIDESLAKLGIEYIDLMLIHAPQPWDDFRSGDYRRGLPRGMACPRGRLHGGQAPLHGDLELPAGGSGEHPRPRARLPCR